MKQYPYTFPIRFEAWEESLIKEISAENNLGLAEFFRELFRERYKDRWLELKDKHKKLK